TRPMIWSWSLYLFCSSTRSGISARHGPHHVAQKFRRVTLLLYSARLTGLPSRVSSLKSGAGSGFRTRRIVGCWANTGAARTQPSNQARSEEHTSELQSLAYLVCRLLLEKK